MKSGQASSCSYEMSSVESKEYHTADTDERIIPRAGEPLKPSTGLSRYSPAPRTTRPQEVSMLGKPLWDMDSSLSSLQAKKIAYLESRLASLETLSSTQASGTLQNFGQVATLVQFGDKRATATTLDLFPTSPREVKPAPETILFRGRNFMTQYYGGSNPTSLIAHVCQATLLGLFD